MDVIFPTLEIIDGISYRVNSSDDYNVQKNADTVPYLEFDDEEEIECGREIVDDEEYDEVEVKYSDDGYFLISVHIPKEFHPIIIGTKGITRQRIEKDTDTYIDVPLKYETGKVEIKGKSRHGVLTAYRRIKIMVGIARAKIPCSHFISIPMVNEEIYRNFERFQEEVLNVCKGCPSIKKELFQDPARLHLTAGVMFLADTEEIDLAVETMISSKTDVVDSIFKGRSLKVRVRGIELMNDDPSEVRVLYAKVEDPSDGFLQELMDKLVDYFVDAGLMEKERSSVKLHMTLMNSVFMFRKQHDVIDSEIRGKSYYFDASKIMEYYKDYDFGTVYVNSIHLSQRRTRSENGYYISSCRLTFY